MDDYVLEEDSSWDSFLDLKERQSLDPNIRLIASLIDLGEFTQVYRRTGVHVDKNGSASKEDFLSLFLDFFPKDKEETLSRITTQVTSVHGTLLLYEVEKSDFLEDADATIAVAELNWTQTGVLKIMAGSKRGDHFRETISRLIKARGIRRASVPTLMQPSLHPLRPGLDSAWLNDIGLPSDRQYKNVTLDGHDVIVGIIDDGCALAHRNFLVPGAAQPTSRIRYLWDQNRKRIPNASWKTPAVPGLPFTPYGTEIDNNAINNALQNRTVNGLIDEDAVYEDLDYEVAIASHGTHVMDIAVGNGSSLIGTEGVAKAADIIFVQLPSQLVADALPLLDSDILKAVQYIFKRADMLSQARGLKRPMPVVINISYGGYTGPHDGTSQASQGIDDQLKGHHDRAVVISAGNSFEADCHAEGTIEPGGLPHSLQWNLSPMDPTANPLEIWYDEQERLSMVLTTPGGTHAFQPLAPGDAVILKRNGQVMGWMENVIGGPKLPNVINILLNATLHETPGTDTQAPGPQPPSLTSPSPSGTWTIGLVNKGQQPARFHAWIGRDDWRGGVVSTHQQSRFAPSDADPRSTIADLATGRLSICVGAHNGDTGEICSYSAAGPTRDNRKKPDLTAPGEEDATRRGILCASSRRSQPSWFNGTSAAAPVIAGLVALMLQYNRDKGNNPLPPSRILADLKKGAIAGRLVGNKRQDVDARRPKGKKQSDCLHDVTGAGKADVKGSMP